jgi:hypothetical protein
VNLFAAGASSERAVRPREPHRRDRPWRSSRRCAEVFPSVQTAARSGPVDATSDSPTRSTTGTANDAERQRFLARSRQSRDRGLCTPTSPSTSTYIADESTHADHALRPPARFPRRRVESHRPVGGGVGAASRRQHVPAGIALPHARIRVQRRMVGAPGRGGRRSEAAHDLSVAGPATSGTRSRPSVPCPLRAYAPRACPRM